MKKAFNVSVLIISLGFLLISLAHADDNGKAAVSGPAVVYKATFPITLQSGEYELQSSIIDFEPGAGMPEHMHGGHVLVVVLDGEIVLKTKEKESVMKAGESWTENPGDLHSVVNAGKTKTRVTVSNLLPKEAEATTLIKQ